MKTKNKAVGLIFIFFLLIVVVFSIASNLKAVAEETTVVLTPEMYTRSDSLLNADGTDDYLLWADTDIEHGQGGKLTTPGVYSETIPLTLDQIEATGCDYLYFRFGANGNKDDDWVIEYQAFEIYLTAKDEAVVDNKSWSDINPLD